MNEAGTTTRGRDTSWMILGGCFLIVGVPVYAMAASHPDRLSAVNAATVASLVSAIISMLLIRFGLSRGADAVATTFVASWLVRLAISVGGSVAAIVLLHLSPEVTLLTMTAYYFAILAAETIIAVGRLKTLAIKL